MGSEADDLYTPVTRIPDWMRSPRIGIVEWRCGLCIQSPKRNLDYARVECLRPKERYL